MSFNDEEGDYWISSQHDAWCPYAGHFLFAYILTKIFTFNCAKPTNFRQTASYTSGGTLYFDYAWDSTTGRLSDMTRCYVGEWVGYIPSELSSSSPPFPAITPFWNNPTEFYGVPGIDGVLHDVHVTPRVSGSKYTDPAGFVRPYSAKSINATQWYRYRCTCYNGNNLVNIAGPISIVRSVSANGGGTWRFVITKSGNSATINPLP